MTNTSPTLAAKVAANAIKTTEAPCYWGARDPEHAGCTVTHYTTAMILTYGSDKAHRIVFSAHSVKPGVVLAPSGPSCGSKRAGLNWVSAGRFAPAVTCGRC